MYLMVAIEFEPIFFINLLSNKIFQHSLLEQLVVRALQQVLSVKVDSSNNKKYDLVCLCNVVGTKETSYRYTNKPKYSHDKAIIWPC
jgi:hypothetical protein